MSGVDRTSAKRLTLVGQTAAALLTAAAVLAFVISPQLPPAPEPPASPPPTTGGTTTAQAPVMPDVDITMLADVLGVAAAIEADEQITRDDDDGPDPKPDPLAPETNAGFRFLGGFFSPSRSLAIIKNANRQTMVRVGDSIDFGYTVHSISPEFVEIERAGEIERIERASPDGSAVTTTTIAKDSFAPGTEVSDSARERLRDARARAAAGTNPDRDKLRRDYERERQRRLEELREQGIDIDSADPRADRRRNE
ncbi:MAG: type II secretion system protein N [Planctomycetota bacterium]